MKTINNVLYIEQRELNNLKNFYNITTLADKTIINLDGKMYEIVLVEKFKGFNITVTEKSFSNKYSSYTYSKNEWCASNGDIGLTGEVMLDRIDSFIVAHKAIDHYLANN